MTPQEANRYILEGHRRLMNPFYNLVMALLACTGLLVGNFNRRGQGKIISCSIAAMVLIEAGDLAFGNLCGKSLYFLTLLYANLIVPFIVCLYLLFFYNPAGSPAEFKPERKIMSFKPFKYALLAAGFGSAALLPFWSFAESAPAPKRERTEIHFSADQVEENSETKVITATGNVNIVREGTTLKADKITYDRKNDKITADGHVNIIQPDGTTVFADSAELEDKMSKGAIHEVKMILADESRVAARRIKQSENKNKYFFYGVYSPCDVCEDNPSPLWQIKARKITHDAANKDVYYQDAFIQIKDIPVFYTPFMSHPTRRSNGVPAFCRRRCVPPLISAARSNSAISGTSPTMKTCCFRRF